MTDDDDIGTVRWFGESWGAPICDWRAHIDNPGAARCLDCNHYIESDDQGISTVASLSIDPSGRVYYHLDCFLRMLGISISDAILIEADDE